MAAAVPKAPMPETGNTSSGAPRAVSLAQYWRPRHWPAWAFIGWLKLTAALPRRFELALHERFGRFLAWALKRRRRIVERNIEICFPNLDRAAVETLALRNFENVGASLAEVALAWFAPLERLAPLYRVEGREHLDAALARGNGVILLSGHFTTLEIASPFVKQLVPYFAFMYRARSSPVIDAYQRRGRARAAHASFPNTDVRTMLKMLKRNAVVWYAPDQTPGSGGVLVPFFGVPAMTNTATARIARISGAPIVPFFFRRLPDDSGYLLRFSPALADVPSGDETHDTARVNAVLEEFIRECPEEYLWMHRKFKGRPAELGDVYASAGTPRDRA